MGEPLFIALVLLLGIAGGMWLQRMIPASKNLFRKLKEETPSIPPESAAAFTRWLQEGRTKNVLDSTTLNIGGDQKTLYEWLQGAPSAISAIIHYGGPVSDNERKRLCAWFWFVLGYLTLIGVASAWYVVGEAAQASPRRLRVAVIAGVLGSCIAAFRSCLDRRANGFEDKDGNVAPGIEKKERFTDGMVVWFLGRPTLGAAVGLLVYAGLMGGVFSAAVKEELLNGDIWKFLFYAALAGLFAKTILDLLLEVVKKVFRVEG